MATPSGARSRREILACAEQGVTVRRRAEVADLETLLAWADVHSGDPQAEPGAIPVKYGGPRLITVGGDGTPLVADLCFAELAIARQAGEVATRHRTGDALDLRHRLPATWAQLQALVCEAWVGCKVARMSRQLSRETVAMVDAAVATAAHEAPGRILAIAEAKIIEADQAAHAQRIAENQTKRGVWLSQPRVGDLVDHDSTAGIRTLTGRLDEADALELDTLIDELADALDAHGTGDPDDAPTRDQLRADALGLLAHPDRALTLLTGSNTGTDEGADGTAGEAPAAPRRPRRSATIYAHVSADMIVDTRTGPAPDGDGTGDTDGTGGTVCTTVGVTRVEHLGPMLHTQLTRLLDGREITLTPVIDLNQVQNVNAYEHPTRVRRRTEMRTVTDVFPHSPSPPGTRIDHDHPVPYDPGGPPGQTGDHNDAPLSRRAHRAKTHGAYRVDQLQLGVYRWHTPHGLTRIITPTGTHKVEPLTTPDGTTIGETYTPAITLDWAG